MDAQEAAKEHVILDSARSTTNLISTSNDKKYAETTFISPDSSPPSLKKNDFQEMKTRTAEQITVPSSSATCPELYPMTDESGQQQQHSERKQSPTNTTKIERFTLEEELPRQRKKGRIKPFLVRELQLKVLQRHNDGEPIKSDSPPPIPLLDLGHMDNIKNNNDDKNKTRKKPRATKKRPKVRSRASTLTTLREVEAESIRRLKSRITLNDLHLNMDEELHVGDIEASEIAGKFVNSLNQIFRNSDKPRSNSKKK